jgi:hypothetical protein
MSDKAPIYVATRLLDLRYQKAYLDKNWTSAWINPEIVGARQIWEEEYNTNIGRDIETTPEDILAALGKLPLQL